MHIGSKWTCSRTKTGSTRKLGQQNAIDLLQWQTLLTPIASPGHQELEGLFPILVPALTRSVPMGTWLFSPTIPKGTEDDADEYKWVRLGRTGDTWRKLSNIRPSHPKNSAPIWTCHATGHSTQWVSQQSGCLHRSWSGHTTWQKGHLDHRVSRKLLTPEFLIHLTGVAYPGPLLDGPKQTTHRGNVRSDCRAILQTVQPRSTF